MPVEIDIAKVARLARLALSDEELATVGEQLTDILEHAAEVQALPTDGVPPTSHPIPMVNSFRDDEVTPSLDREEVLSQAPDAIDGYFRVPRILDEE
ncbi:MAG: Asp-tRNA(Asn)/Glu-tRNA(Gln) amidotransferase subunit GatC [Acidimicrobiia bacterium]|nr:Asp-tRNA(Asn)/Glu-tRNA(Gln) amidotransferase subunit GatC [Acidimicrobiia bacterium]NNC75620.1 Asp-tRNA(Asn)/Glu-tRNA(Gln) amidotransferase subunit GatC [Acidimicrobiia bacterium]